MRDAAMGCLALPIRDRYPVPFISSDSQPSIQRRRLPVHPDRKGSGQATGHAIKNQDGSVHIKQTSLRPTKQSEPNRDGTSVIKIATKLTVSIPEEQWDVEINRKFGLCLIPSLLLRAQQPLGLNPTQLLLLVQLCDCWTDPDQSPAPSKKNLSERLGLSERQIQRHLSELEKAGLIARIERQRPDGGLLANAYDLSGLMAALKKLI
jgi:DNA-binding transcriptional ArsR family regulator